MPSIEITTAADYGTAIGAMMAEVKRDLRITTQDDNALLYDLLRDAFEYAEHATGRSLLTQTLAVQFDAGEAVSPIRLPRSPVQSITSVKTYDTDGTETTVASTEYRLEGTTGAATYVDAALLVADGGGWRIDRRHAAVKVTYVAGYGGHAALPRDIRRAVLRQAAAFWMFRADTIVGTTVNAAPVATVDALLWPYRLGVV